MVELHTVSKGRTYVNLFKSIARAAAALAFAALIASVPAAARADKDIVDTAVEAGSFKTLVAAVKAAGLVDALKGDGPFTVFAPTDAAFKKLPKGTVETLLKPENKEKLIAILKYHVASGKIMAADAAKLTKPTKVKSLNGQSFTVVNKGGVHVDKAKVIKADIVCSNGVIHVIDSVILPK
jgi:transforming growth factor-beta-induced protein